MSFFPNPKKNPTQARSIFHNKTCPGAMQITNEAHSFGLSLQFKASVYLTSILNKYKYKKL